MIRLLISLLALSSASAFAPTVRKARTTSLSAVSRRDVLASSAAATIPLLANLPLAAWADEGIGTKDKPIVVLGSSGKTGKLIVNKLVALNLYTTAATRSGSSSFPSSPYLSTAVCDVTSPTSLTDALKSASACVFAASASKKGGDAKAVDYKGVAYTAQACVDNSVPKLVVVSSGAVTRPESVGFKITNVFGRIMDYKIAGENELRNIYKSSKTAHYTIVRPGGLSEQPSTGAAGVEVSQGDIFSAEIGRDDVANLVVARSTAGAKTDDVTFECYGSGGETMFGMKTGPAKLSKSLTSKDELVHRSSDSFASLVNNLLTDAELAKTGIVSDYKGTDIEPL